MMRDHPKNKPKHADFILGWVEASVHFVGYNSLG
jgi:hypothetical protein